MILQLTHFSVWVKKIQMRVAVYYIHNDCLYNESWKFQIIYIETEQSIIIKYKRILIC